MNKRRTDLKYIGFWLSPQEVERLDKLAASRGLNRADFLRAVLKLLVEQPNLVRALK